MSIEDDQYNLIYEELKDNIDDYIRDFIVNNYPVADVEEALEVCRKMINDYGIE